MCINDLLVMLFIAVMEGQRLTHLCALWMELKRKRFKALTHKQHPAGWQLRWYVRPALLIECHIPNYGPPRDLHWAAGVGRGPWAHCRVSSKRELQRETRGDAVARAVGEERSVLPRLFWAAGAARGSAGSRGRASLQPAPPAAVPGPGGTAALGASPAEAPALPSGAWERKTRGGGGWGLRFWGGAGCCGQR